MPTGDINYKNSLIYKLHCKDSSIENIYIGSTTNFRGRKSQHKTSCTNPKSKKYNISIYKFIRENGGWDNWYMTMICEFPCNNKRELEQKEREVIEEYGFDNCLNCLIPIRTVDEKKKYHKQYEKRYYELNKEQIKKKCKIYRDTNKEQIKKFKNEKISCICGTVCRKNDKARHERSKKHQSFINTN